ncbi:hypothetical protein OHV86_10010 [Acinetobacter baumannii]|nr:hypothetical protein [Acinetobacter baumannii]
MNDLITRYLNNLGQWHDVALAMAKAIVAIGVFCLVTYLLTIGYIPSEISFGDTLIFLLIFAACSTIYFALSMVLFLLGMSLMPVIYIILKVSNKYLPPHKQFRDDLPFPKISITTFCLFIYFIYTFYGLFFAFWQISLYAAITVSLIALLYYAFYVNRKDIKIFNKKFKNIEDIIDDNSASENLKTFAKEKLKRLEISKRNSLQMACLLITVPLVYMFPFGGVGKVFLNSAMEKTGIRIEKATLYIKEPYANLIELPKTTTKELNHYKTFIFKDVKVLFQGIGKSTLVSYKVKDMEKQLVIPNEYITVERSKKIEE